MIKENLDNIKKQLPENVTLVAVSKTKPIIDLQEAYDAGQRIFGENKIQEMVTKYDALPKDIQWHMIGHLQRNKVNCLLQAHIAEESTKFGLSFNEIEEILSSEKIQELKNIKIVGVMGMATFTDNQSQVKKEFLQLKSTFDKLKTIKIKNCKLKTISMGMSNDYQLAIECGSTMVRVGSSIFGKRNYSK